jgi:hypothetical protein
VLTGNANLVLAGLIAFTMTLAKEGIKYNIKSNVIAPVSHHNDRNSCRAILTGFGFSYHSIDRRLSHDRYHHAPRYPQTPYSRVYRSRSRCAYGSQRKSSRDLLDVTLAEQRHTLSFTK